MIKQSIWAAVASSGLVMASPLASALETGIEGLSANAFGSLSAARLAGEPDGVRYGANAEYKDSWSLESNSRAALQATYQIAPRLSATGQLLANRNGNSNGIEADVEWAFLSYQATKETTLRGGALRTPIYLLSENLDVGYSYPWVRPPQAFYSIIPMSNYYRADVLTSFAVPGGRLQLQPWYANKAEENDINIGDAEYDVDVEDILGLNVKYQSALGLFRIGYSEGDLTASSSDLPALVAIHESSTSFLSVGYQVEWNDWVSMAEWAKVDGKDTRNNAGQLTKITEEKAAYLMVGYQFDDWMPHVTVTKRSSTNSDPSPLGFVADGEQNSFIVGVRYDVLPNAALKMEYEKIDTAGGYRGGFTGLPTQDREAELFTISVDFVL